MKQTRFRVEFNVTAVPLILQHGSSPSVYSGICCYSKLVAR